MSMQLLKDKHHILYSCVLPYPVKPNSEGWELYKVGVGGGGQEERG